MKRSARSGRIRRYREVLERRARMNATPGFLKALLATAILLGVALPFRLTPLEAKETVLGALGVTPTPLITPIPATETVSHVTVVLKEPTPAPTPGATAVPKQKIQILVYHTHATEAYRQTGDSTYEESGDCRTKEQDKSVVEVGKRLSKLLEETYGYDVTHDTENYEPPKLATAYSRSLAAMKKAKKGHPTLRYFIDVHRDAYGSSVSGEKDYVLIEGKECARLMFVVGNGQGATGTGFSEMPDFDENFAFASRITDSIRELEPLFMRDVRVKTGRYNQHVSDRCLLIEVGHNANTLSQALNSVPYLAAALDEAIKKDAA